MLPQKPCAPATNLLAPIDLQNNQAPEAEPCPELPWHLTERARQQITSAKNRALWLPVASGPPELRTGRQAAVISLGLDKLGLA